MKPKSKVVRSLAVKVSPAMAEQRLARPLMWRQPLRRLALAFVPFVTFDAEVEAINFKQRYSVSLEAAAGKLDAYRAEHGDPLDLHECETTNAIAVGVSERDLEGRSCDVIRRETYQRGFARIKHLQIKATRTPDKDFHVPFWVGFYGDQDLRLRVLNANTGRIQGRKACELFEQWLAQ